jgi:hypothetical protein
LDVVPVADHDDQLFPRITGQPLRERIQGHRADHQDQLLLPIRFDGKNHFRGQRAGEMAKGGQHTARVEDAIRRREKLLAHLKDGEDAFAGPVLIQDRQRANILFIHDAQRLGRCSLRRHAHDVGLHHVPDFRRHVRDKPRRRYIKRFQNEINAVVGVAAARGDSVGQAGPTLELSVTDGRANRVRVRIPMADDQHFAHSVSTRLTADGRPEQAEEGQTAGKQG